MHLEHKPWITGHVNAYRYFGGVTRILTPDNLKTGVLKNSRTETVLNKAYQEMAEHYGTRIASHLRSHCTLGAACFPI